MPENSTDKTTRSPSDILDADFVHVRSNLLDVAAFLDRVDRAGSTDDFRYRSFQAALDELSRPGPHRTRAILDLLSDPTSDPVDSAPGKGAAGAWPDFGKETA